MKAYKGFNSQLQCAPNNKIFQFEIGETYEEKKAILCKSGFHACIDPIDVLRFYDPANSRFCEVDIEDVSEERDPDNSKICGKKITIIKEYTIIEFIELCKEYYESNIGVESTASNTDDESTDSNTGDYSIASNTGHCSIALITGHCSIASNTGDYSIASNAGHYSIASNTGHCSIASNAGDKSIASNSGYRSIALNTGDHSKAEITKANSIAIVSGYKSRAKGVIGSWLVLVEWDKEYENIQNIKSKKVDGEIIKENTYYQLIDGKFVEVEK